MTMRRKAEKQRRQEQLQLRQQLYALQCTLDELHAQFDAVTDSQQVSACIYEMNAVMARYDHTLRCIKAFEAE